MIAKETDSATLVPSNPSSRSGLANDPLSSDDILTGFYRPDRSDWQERGTPGPEAKPRPTHYKVICISMYTDDLGRLDSMVDELKARGVTKASRSALIRAALDQVDLEKIPRGM